METVPVNLRKKLFIYSAILLAYLPIYSIPKTITLFSHGIADTYKQAYQYAKTYTKKGYVHTNQRYLFHTPYVSFNYPDATDKFYRVNWKETSFGQANEIGRLLLAYQRTIEKHKNCNIILFGLSRGAANQTIFAGLYQFDNVKAIVLESPYSALNDIIRHMMNKKSLWWLPVSYGETIAEFIFQRYTRHGFSPERCLENISKDIPILIICSKEDYLVPVSSSINIYKKLIAAGHKHTYIFITEHGEHSKILQGPDGERYQYVVNAFYKKYNLPHCRTSAAKGKQLLVTCQPVL